MSTTPPVGSPAAVTPDDVQIKIVSHSNLFYWFITVFSDCRHVNKREVDAFPVALDRLITSPAKAPLMHLASALMTDLKKKSETRKMRFKHDTLTVQCIYPKASKPIVDEIDRALARHYASGASLCSSAHPGGLRLAVAAVREQPH